jgi:hypothetical protein
VPKTKAKAKVKAKAKRGLVELIHPPGFLWLTEERRTEVDPFGDNNKKARHDLTKWYG